MNIINMIIDELRQLTPRIVYQDNLVSSGVSVWCANYYIGVIFVADGLTMLVARFCNIRIDAEVHLSDPDLINKMASIVYGAVRSVIKEHERTHGIQTDHYEYGTKND